MTGRGRAAGLLVLLAACGPTLPPGGDPRPPAPGVPLAAVPVRLAPVSVTGIRRGAVVGNAVFGVDCAPPYSRILWTKTRFGDGMGLFRPINDTLTESGMILPRPGGPVAAPLSLTAEVTGLTMELCRRKGWLTGSPLGESGVAVVQVAWTLAGPHGPLHRTATTGRAEIPPTPDGDAVLLETAVADAAGLLAADDGFRRALAASAAGLPPPLGAAVLEPAAPGARGTAVAVGGGSGTVVGRIGGYPVLVAAGRGDEAAVAVALGGRSVPGMVERTAPSLGLMLVRVMEAVPGPLPAFALSAQRRPAVGAPLWAADGPRNAGLLAEWRTADGGARLLADLPGAGQDAPPGTPLMDADGAALAIVTGPATAAGLVPAVPVRAALAALGVGVDP
ncbi:hypothetical protein M2352_000695 [Azospirillum fermentarium]|uniref:hypothetical protein n=1 Tax=Azospirillum fermentarium TaxID=1233114 RepID=UPI00222767D5|nr:hypothetical protein [Azospirillum fermentarium]MCW2245104.1 hypothetical protein [Azospirillum fermentarium]